MLETWNRLLELTGHSFSTVGRPFSIVTPGCKPGDKVCFFYGGHLLHILRWRASGSDPCATHGDDPTEFCGVAFAPPYVMKPQKSDDARLGPDGILSSDRMEVPSL
jgi:hypothetical protein